MWLSHLIKTKHWNILAQWSSPFCYEENIAPEGEGTCRGLHSLRDKAKIPISSSVKELYFMKFKILFLMHEKWDMRLSVPSLCGLIHCRVKVYVCFRSGNRRKMKGKYLLPDWGTEASLEKSITRQSNLWCFRNLLPWLPVEILFPTDASSQVS